MSTFRQEISRMGCPETLATHTNNYEAISQPMSAPERKPGSAVSRRCRQLREALGFSSSAAFARMIGVTPARWNNVENGLPLSNDMAFRVKRHVPGVALDWLYDGDRQGLSKRLDDLLYHRDRKAV